MKLASAPVAVLLCGAALAAALGAGCPPVPAEAALAPAGLAGAPTPPAGAAGSVAAAPLALPGNGAATVDPVGGGQRLPPGHPPIDGSAAPAASASAPASLGDAAAGSAGVGQVVKGTVAETLEVPEYTYLRLTTASGDTWAAITKAPVKVGDTVSVSVSIVMPNFTSKTLNKTFDKLVMGSLVPST